MFSPDFWKLSGVDCLAYARHRLGSEPTRLKQSRSHIALFALVVGAKKTLATPSCLFVCNPLVVLLSQFPTGFDSHRSDNCVLSGMMPFCGRFFMVHHVAAQAAPPQHPPQMLPRPRSSSRPHLCVVDACMRASNMCSECLARI